MVAYFKTLFNYDRHTNIAIIDTLLSSGITIDKPRELMAHTLAAQQTWLKRCKNLPATGGPLWPDWTVNDLKAIVEQNHRDWIAYLDTLHHGDLEQSMTYINTKGDMFTNSIRDTLTQVTNHGTHHRAQIGQLLKSAGIESLPVTDYIFFIRGL
jgi:uncharacterized damage-inducible protein DinB